MARKSKDRTHAKKRAHQQQLAAKTAASRERRLSNKHKREAIHDTMPDVKVTMVCGVAHNDDGDIIELVNGIYKLVPLALPEGAIKPECDTTAVLESYEDCHRNRQHVGIPEGKRCSSTLGGKTTHSVYRNGKFENTCEHGNALTSNCSDCDEDVLGMSVTAEEPRKVILRNDPGKQRVTCVYPEDEPKSAFSRLKDKLRGNQ